jgi:hypothetical protein
MPVGTNIPYKQFYKSSFIESLRNASTPTPKTYIDYTVTYMGKSNTEGMKEFDVFDVSNRTESYKIRILQSAMRGDPRDALMEENAHIKKRGENEKWYNFLSKMPITNNSLKARVDPVVGLATPKALSPVASCSKFSFSSTGRLSESMQKYVPSISKDRLGFDDPFLDNIGSSQLGQGYSFGFSVNKKFLNDNPLIYLAGIPGNNPEDEYLRWFLEGPIDPARIDLSRKILVDLRCGNLFLLKKEKPLSDELWHAINDESARRRLSGINPNPWADPKPKKLEGGVYKQKYLKYKQKYLKLSALMHKF